MGNGQWAGTVREGQSAAKNMGAIKTKAEVSIVSGIFAHDAIAVSDPLANILPTTDLVISKNGNAEKPLWVYTGTRPLHEWPPSPPANTEYLKEAPKQLAVKYL